ncbi:MAG TPA: type II toxin-antitoxin system RelE/ParE family toxin [Cryomorphaceae bacterium]|nr:type II toxin-antitoxin system RelE/ParE family toxin [Cryomorphaceae bacterium]
MNIRLSTLAEFKLLHLLQYLEEEWSVKSKEKFLNTFRSKMEYLSQNPLACKQSDVRSDLRSLVLTKQNTLFYTIQADSILVVTIFDSRQNPDELRKEIAEHFDDYTND